MWWLYYNAGQLLTLVAGIGFLPHYTVAFKPLFEFIVLGVIPGTSIVIGYLPSLLLVWVLITIALLGKMYRKPYQQTILHQ